METIFHNVLISIDAETPEKAYEKLCLLLNTAGVEYTTNTYSTYPSTGKGKKSTVSLWPKE